MVKAKLELQLNPQDWHQHGSETVWIEPLDDTDENGVFRIVNTPYFAQGLSWGDIVRVKASPDGRVFILDNVVSRSGHSTYRILVNSTNQDFSEILGNLRRLGCSFELTNFGDKHLYALDVPANADVYEVYNLLEVGERRGVLEFEEGHVGHAIKRD